MRLFGKVDSAINRFDRANWQSGGPWWGFDLAYGAPAVPVVLIGTFDVACVMAGTGENAKILNGTGDNALILAGTFDSDAI